MSEMKTILKDRDLYFDGESAWDEDAIIKQLFSGANIDDLFCKARVKHCKYKEKCDTIAESSLQIPKEYLELDLHALFIELVKDKGDEAKKRMLYELELYEERGFLDVLRLMCYMRDKFIQNNVIWGVGRGSSVSSYLLYLLGIHLIDPLKYDLDIHEFLKL